jgi:hypothetical protein
LILYEDTRQKVGKHITKNKYWKNHNITVVRQKLYVGDYVFEPNIENCKVSIDTKQNILELVCDMWCDSKRFQKECIKAKNNNITLIFLIEEKFDKEQLLNWQSRTDMKGKKYINISGKQIYYKMLEYIKLYGCKFKCCHKNSSGKIIIEILTKYQNQAEK